MSEVMREPFPNHPPPITARPEGLLSLLGLQSNGKYPQHLHYQELTVGLDLLRWYLNSQATVVTGTYSFQAGSFQSSAALVVPGGQQWLLMQYHALNPNVAVLPANGFLALADNIGGTGLVPLGPVSAAVANDRHMIWQGDWMEGVIVRPGQQIGLYGLLGTTATYNFTLRFVRLQV